MGNPEIVILDEPTVGLDPKQIIEIRDMIKLLGKDHTVILSSHILSEVQAICQTVMIISKGKLVACDSPRNLEKVFSASVTVELVAEATKSEIRSILSGVGRIMGTQIQEREPGRCHVRLRVDADDDEQLCRDIFSAFSKAGKMLLQMNTAKASLEDIFIELTDEKGKTGKGGKRA